LGSRGSFERSIDWVWNTAKTVRYLSDKYQVRDAEIKWDVDYSADTDRGRRRLLVTV
jgi:hypothetical protein